MTGAKRGGNKRLGGRSSKETGWWRKNEETRQGLNLGEGDESGLNGTTGKKKTKNPAWRGGAGELWLIDKRAEGSSWDFQGKAMMLWKLPLHLSEHPQTPQHLVMLLQW